MAFQNRQALIKNGAKILAPEMMRIIYEGVCVDGKLKNEKNPEEGAWDDTITGNLAMKKKGQQSVLDDNLCQIEDLDGKPYAWTALDGKNLKEVVFEVDKIVFGDQIRVHLNYRLIVPEEKAVPKVTTKRRSTALVQQSDATTHDTKTTESTATAGGVVTEPEKPATEGSNAKKSKPNAQSGA